MWAQWDPKPALEFAAKARPKLLPSLLVNAVVGPWDGLSANTTHHGLAAVQNFDLSKVPKSINWDLEERCTALMEHAGELSIGETAKFGYKVLQHLNHVPRKRLLDFFAGKTDGLSEDSIIDRTFCALRVWAACKPDEMKAWIATLQDPEMQKALTWLPENPWGSGRDAE